jgi:hypothetical protein
MNLFAFVLMLVPYARSAETFEGYTFYVGDPHVHTGISGDGMSSDLHAGCGSYVCGAFADVFDIAKDAGLDWMSITDHTTGIRIATDDDFDYSWATMLAHDDSDGLVVVPGGEDWISIDGSSIGHRNLYYFGTTEELEDMKVSDFSPTTADGEALETCDEFHEWVESLESRFGPVLTIPHHPAFSSPASVDWSCVLPVFDAGVEVYSAWGSSLGDGTHYDEPTSGIASRGTVRVALSPDDYAIEGLAFLGGTDSHDTEPGVLCDGVDRAHYSSGGLTVVFAPEEDDWNRSAIYDALLARRSYATSGPALPLVLEWSAGGYVLGGLGEDIHPSSTLPLDLEVRVPADWAAAILSVVAVGPSIRTDLLAASSTSFTLSLDAADVPEWLYIAVELDGPATWDGVCDDGGTDDEEWVWTSPSWFYTADADADGFDDVAWGGTDCDDSAASISPASAEIWYDGIDEDCDGADDYDADGDGDTAIAWGGTDCDDTDPSINPAAREIWYDGKDENCDGANDFDADGDGDRPLRWGGTDCDDTDPLVHPGVAETFYDGVDQDCDGRSDFDFDGDGYDSDLYGGTDCNDYNRAIHPHLLEHWYDGIDRNCDGRSDFDRDGDGYDSDHFGGTDCNDHDPRVHPGQPDPFFDGIDADCDGADGTVRRPFHVLRPRD